ncbi:hypothetical protein ACFPJ4_07400 [Lysinimonas soli]|uniref:Uncharacterized protein n=1 Tax=Lysinimonas soli TaxID=1074233 RepID=A0ABW0NQU7_9MICO
MESWRDDASQESQDDLDAMCETALDRAINAITKRGSLYPFAVTVSLGGSVGLSMVQLGPDGPVDGNAVAEVYWRVLRSQRDELRACTLVLDTRIPSLKSDAIRLDSEHREGIALRLLAPYQRRRLPRRLDLGEFHLEAGTATIWT